MVDSYKELNLKTDEFSKHNNTYNNWLLNLLQHNQSSNTNRVSIDGSDGFGSSIGNHNSINTSNINSDELLVEILQELKKLNFQMSMVTNTTLKNEDLNVEEE